MVELTFEEPAELIPAPAECEMIAKGLRANMGEWYLIGRSETAGAARQRAYMFRLGQQTGFGPPGAFESESKTLFGEFRVYVRYVGGERV